MSDKELFVGLDLYVYVSESLSNEELCKGEVVVRLLVGCFN